MKFMCRVLKMVRAINIYFIHSTHLRERERIIADFKTLLGKYTFNGINRTSVKIISEYDPNVLNEEIIRKTVDYSRIKDEKEGKPLEFYNQHLKNMHIFQLSNTLKHYKALEMISKTEDNDVNIVLEDDILYEEKVLVSLEKVLRKLKGCDDSVTFLGLPCNVQNPKKEIMFQKTKEIFRILPYTDSYIVSNKLAKKMHDNFLPIKFINNIHFSYTFEKSGIDSQIAIPNIFMDGSKYGIFLSTLSPNNHLIFNNDFMTVANIINKNELDKADRDKVTELFEKSQIAKNPDFMYLRALFYTKLSEYEKAKEIYEEIFKIYDSNTNVINAESSVLRDYIRLHRHLQKV